MHLRNGALIPSGTTQQLGVEEDPAQIQRVASTLMSGVENRHKELANTISERSANDGDAGLFGAHEIIACRSRSKWADEVSTTTIRVQNQMEGYYSPGGIDGVCTTRIHWWRECCQLHCLCEGVTPPSKARCSSYGRIAGCQRTMLRLKTLLDGGGKRWKTISLVPGTCLFIPRYELRMYLTDN